MRISHEGATFIIRDEGPGFDPNKVPDPTAPENLEAVCGRGIWLMRSLMDEVDYNETGNEVTLEQTPPDLNAARAARRRMIARVAEPVWHGLVATARHG